jgi:thiazole synthase ThiGH ThiG subunit
VPQGSIHGPRLHHASGPFLALTHEYRSSGVLGASDARWTTRELADTLSVPVVASGGITDGRGLVAALILGAEAVQMGTAFLVCEESGANPEYKRAVLGSTEDARPSRGPSPAGRLAVSKTASSSRWASTRGNSRPSPSRTP